MGLLSRKLHSQRGASFLIAMLFFLVCAFVGAVILSSATTNVQKVRERWEDQQAYYAVSSAARLLRDVAETDKCEGWEDKWEYGCSYSHSNSGAHRCTETNFYEKSKKDFLTAAAWAIYRSQTQYCLPEGSTSYSTTFTVDVGEDLPKVLGTLTMDENYNAVAVLRPELNGSPADAYAMTLRLQAVVNRDPGTETLWCQHEVAVVEGNPVLQSFTGTKSTLTTTIKWDRGVISKGVSVGG